MCFKMMLRFVSKTYPSFSIYSQVPKEALKQVFCEVKNLRAF